MIIVYLVIFFSMLILGGGAVYGLFWSAKSGQLKDIKQGAYSIFDEDECVGKQTDYFPGMKKQK